MKEIQNYVEKVREKINTYILPTWKLVKGILLKKTSKAAVKMILFSLALIFLLSNIATFEVYQSQKKEMTSYEVVDKEGTKRTYEVEFEMGDTNIDRITFESSQSITQDNLSVQIYKKEEPLLDQYDFLCEEIEEGKYQIDFSIKKEINYEKTLKLVIEEKGLEESLNLEKAEIVTYSFQGILYLGLLLMIAFAFIVWIVRTEDKIVYRKPHRIKAVTIAMCALCAVIAFISVESMYNPNVWGLRFNIVLGNVLTYFLIFFGMVFLLNSQRWGILICSVAFYILGVANYYVLQFRSQPIQPIDISSFKTAMEVSGQYSYDVTKEIVMSTAFLITIVLSLFMMRERKFAFSRKAKISQHITGVGVACVIFIVITSDLYLKQYAIDLNQWTPTLTYNANGFALSFTSFGKEMMISKPEGYSKEEILAVQDSVEQTKETKEQVQTKPNIIVIMNETFSDLANINPLETTAPYLDYFYSLDKDVIRGKMLVSVFGGSTADSEYEFLTGNSIELFKVHAVPYATCINGENYSLATTLKSQGYATYAMHPSQASNWNRNKVYPLLGFDEFYSIDDFEDPEYARNLISDQCDYEKLVEIYEDRDEDKPFFMFNVTIQNHAGYPDNCVPETVAVANQNYSDVSQYLSLIKQSDDALQYLIEYFKKCEEPTIIVLFGDHYPNFSKSSGFYDWLYGKSEDQLSLEEVQKKYTIPYMIWTNYDIEEQTDTMTSANYLSSTVLDLAGLEMPTYNQFLLNMKEQIPALNVNGYIGADGNYYTYDEETEYSDLINTYDILQYNELLDRKHRVDSMFSVGGLNGE